ncbi:hypothetical protein ACFSSF_09555 [Dietzia aerolata]|uniref:hypothetical protein n=1 Tax=Dietzia aerolata TaxID=595984 RepID=UPI00363117DC
MSPEQSNSEGPVAPHEYGDPSRVSAVRSAAELIPSTGVRRSPPGSSAPDPQRTLCVGERIHATTDLIHPRTHLLGTYIQFFSSIPRLIGNPTRSLGGFLRFP